MDSTALVWIPVLPLAGALFNLLVGRKLPRWTVHLVAVAAVMTAFILVLTNLIGVGGPHLLKDGPLLDLFHNRAEGKPVELTQTVWTWIEVGSFKVDFALRLDTLSCVMCLIITGVGTLIHIYSTGYMAEEPRYAAYFGYLNLFTGSMLILVLGKSLPILFIGWEGVGVCSYLLIGFWFTNEAYATAGRKAFVVNRIGDFAFLLGMFLMFYATGSLDFGDYRALSPAAIQHLHEATWGGDRMAMIACVLLFIGACGKSAQIPLYVWLPDAMAGPTPVSALIHAATMVTAGVYMVARMSFIYVESTTALLVVATIGMLTALAAAFMAFAQTDLKKVLAYSTVSQLGFMFVGVGTGNSVAAIFHLGTHAFFKAGLFLAAGSVMHAMSGSGDITRMGGLRRYLPITHACFLIYCLAISGIFPFAGFFSKDDILAGAYASVHEGWPSWYRYFLWAGLSAAALGTAVYMWRLYFLVFAGDLRADDETRAHIHESPGEMTWPLIILAVLTVFAGVVGLPAAFHAGEYSDILGQWLEPSLADIPSGHLNDGRIWELMALALAIGGGGIALAWRLYGHGPSKQVERFVATETGHDLYEASKNKLWVDEFYDAVIVRPFRKIATGLFEIVDRWIIDTALVEGLAKLIGLFGRLARWVQNGQVQRYMVGVILGAALIFFLAGRGSHPSIGWHTTADGIELDAYPGGGLESKAAKLRWDLQGDGTWDLKPEAEARMAQGRADRDTPQSPWRRMVTLLQQAHVKVPFLHEDLDLSTVPPANALTVVAALPLDQLHELEDRAGVARTDTVDDALIKELQAAKAVAPVAVDLGTEKPDDASDILDHLAPEQLESVFTIGHASAEAEIARATAASAQADARADAAEKASAPDAKKLRDEANLADGLAQRAPVALKAVDAARDSYAAYLGIVTPHPDDYVSDPVITRPAGVIGPEVRLEITDPIAGTTRIVTAHVPVGGK